MPKISYNMQADNLPQGQTKVIVCKSMPRSGHHFLVSLLENTFEKEFSYCPFYTNKDCCELQPCEKKHSGLLFMQKSHDFQLSDPNKISKSYKYLIQYRHPIPRLFSDWALYTWKTQKDGDYESFQKFAFERKKYYIDFAKKWIIPFSLNDSCFLMSYESLVGEPVRILQNFVRFALDDPKSQIDRNTLTQSQTMVKVPRQWNGHKYYEKRDFLNEYQTSIIQELPEIPYLPISL